MILRLKLYVKYLDVDWLDRSGIFSFAERPCRQDCCPVRRRGARSRPVAARHPVGQEQTLLHDEPFAESTSDKPTLVQLRTTQAGGLREAEHLHCLQPRRLQSKLDSSTLTGDSLPDRMRTSVLRILFSLGSLTCLGAVCLAQGLPSAEQLLNDLACGSCHSGIVVESDIQERTPDLTDAGLRYSPDYLFSFLLYPVRIRQHIGFSRMPNFYLDQRESLALTLFLGEQVSPGSQKPDFPSQTSFETVKSSNPDVTASMGEALFLSLNCLGCHKHASLDPWEEKIAPNLGFQGARVTAEWLTAYLRRPQALRPFGYFPGTGSRHPDFLLTENEVDTLASFWMGQWGGFDYPAQYYDPKALILGANVGQETLVRFLEPTELVRFSMTKAEGLLREKLPCLGCHRLGDDGGRIGPDLSSLATRLQPDFALQIIRNPQGVLAETIMPLVVMPPKTADVIENFLIQQSFSRDSLRYLSLVENGPLLHQDLEGGERLYVKHCAVCHGIRGDGDGYNAEYLPVAPVKHSDSTYMSSRPDDVLFDGIYAGGYILNKSQRMPPWGFTLERSEIWQLVAYMRQLCRCEGPAWSRDNKRLR